MTISCVQTSPTRGAFVENLHQASALLENADADLIILPELFASGYFFSSTEEAHAAAEIIPDGPTVRWLEGQARARGAVLVAGLPERTGEGANARYYNSAVVVTPQGWVGTYRKVHLFYEETLHFMPGDLGFPVFTVTNRAGESYRLGVMVCFDWYYPEASRMLALGGADVIAHPSNLVLPHCPDSMPVRARENKVFTATANRVGEESNGRETLRFIGRSRICAPGGSVLADAGGLDASVIATKKLNVTTARHKVINLHNDLFAGRRPAAYGLLVAEGAESTPSKA